MRINSDEYRDRILNLLKRDKRTLETQENLVLCAKNIIFGRCILRGNEISNSESIGYLGSWRENASK